MGVAYPQLDCMCEGDIRVQLQLGSGGVELGACPQVRTHGLHLQASITHTCSLGGGERKEVWSTSDATPTSYAHLYEREGDQAYPEYDVETSSDCGQLSVKIPHISVTDLVQIDDG